MRQYLLNNITKNNFKKDTNIDKGINAWHAKFYILYCFEQKIQDLFVQVFFFITRGC